MSLEPPFLRSVVRDRIEDPSVYPFSIPAVEALDRLELSAVTYFIGENGAGKSTLLEALAVAAGFDPEGGSMNFDFRTRRSESSLSDCLRFVRPPRRPRTGFFLRAESFFNLATEIERLDAEPAAAPPVGSQFIIATHAPIVLAYPMATIYQLDEGGIQAVDYDATELVQLTRDFLDDRGRFLRRLLGERAVP